MNKQTKRKLKRRMKSKFCPICGNKNLKMVAGGVAGIYECKKCGFRGAIFPEIDRKEGKEVKFCPRCKSENVYITTVFTKSSPKFPAPHLGMNKCRDCGFESLIFPTKIKKEKRRRKVKKNG